MSRVSQGIKNTKVSFLFYFVLLVLAFFSRKIFIEYLGVEIVGLNSSIISILDILNLSELGIGTAIAASLYKPLYDKSYQKINDIVSILGYFYRIIGYVVIGLGAILLLCLPFIFEGKGVSMIWVYTAFSAFFVSNMVSFFISYQQTLLTADQKYYEIIFATNLLVMLKIVIQIIMLKYLDFGYISWLIAEIIYSFILGFWLVFRTRRLYGWIDISVKRGKQIKGQYPDVYTTSKQVIPHRVSAVALAQTDYIVIIMLTSLESVTLYTNYALLMSKSIMLVSTTFNGLMAGVGNLITQGNIVSIKQLFWEFNTILIIVATVFAIGLYYISSPFVGLWLGGEYILDNWIVLLLSINVFMAIMRLTLIYFTNGYSLFKDTWAAYCEVSLNVILSFLLGFYWGIAGVMTATTISVSFIMIWKPYFFYREIFKQRVWWYWLEISKYLLSIVVAWGVIHLIFVKNNLYMQLDSYFGLFVNSVIITLIVILVMSVILYPLSAGMRDTVKRFVFIVTKHS